VVIIRSKLPFVFVIIKNLAGILVDGKKTEINESFGVKDDER
jgi:hypothetical protein